MTIRIILADDHRIIRDGLCSLLKHEPDIEVVGEADDGRGAVEMARKLKPDIVVMDLAMPDLNGIEATRQITKADGIKVLALSMHSDKRFVVGALQAGASGYILKDCAFEELVRAIHIIAMNQTYLSPKIAELVVERLRHQQIPISQSTSVLTTREREVLQLIAEGKAVKEIAMTLSVSHKTIETHRAEIMKKLKIYSVAELTKYAVREGLTSLDS
jgi:DNA-binding NarL/FixJ family response regulator